jgi:hypothetical protein
MSCLALAPHAGGVQTVEIAQIETRILCQLGARIYDLQVLRREKGLILRGRTRTYYAKQLAQHAVMAVTDLPILANEIEVS